MGKSVLIIGGSGMIGSEVLRLALASTEVSKVVSLVRKQTENTHEKLQEILVEDFTNYSNKSFVFENIDAAYFCIGVYTGQVPDDQFKTITVDYSVAFAEQLNLESPNARLCLLSGAGADRSEKSKTAFARYKGMAENQISKLDLSFHTFRPGYIYPETPRQEPNLMYKISRFLYPVFKLFGDKYSIPSTHLAKAIFTVGLYGGTSEILENNDIVTLYNTKT